MVSQIESQAFEALLAEQEAVQAGKFQGRQLSDYSKSISPGQEWHIPRSDAVTDFLRPFCANERVSIDGVIQGMADGRGDSPLRWVEMGGGRGLAMRQIAVDAAKRGRVVMTNVDLFDYGLEGVTPDDMAYLERLSPGMTDDKAAPTLIRADIETVKLPEPADLITSVETVQYLNNPLAAIGNWYNQLADDGLAIVSAEKEWSRWIHYHKEPGQHNQDETPAKHLLDALKAAGVRYDASNELDLEDGTRPPFDPTAFGNLVIQKTPGTQMVVNSPVMEVLPSYYGFKGTYYTEPPADSRPIVEIVAA